MKVFIKWITDFQSLIVIIYAKKIFWALLAVRQEAQKAFSNQSVFITNSKINKGYQKNGYKQLETFIPREACSGYYHDGFPD